VAGCDVVRDDGHILLYPVGPAPLRSAPVFAMNPILLQLTRRAWPAFLIACFAALAAARAARIEAYCFSVRFQPATAASGSFELMTTASPLDAEPNGELALQGSTSPYTHGGAFKLTYQVPGLTHILYGILLIDLPLGDADNDGIPDILEVDLGVLEEPTGGTVTSEGGTGSAAATWTRPAGSRFGTCVLSVSGLRSLATPIAETYTITFEVIQYRGSFPFQRTGDAITAPVKLAQVGAAEHTLAGELAFTRVHESLLQDSAAVLTDETGAQFPLRPTGDYTRDGTWFSGVLVFDDYFTTTAKKDYRLWLGVIADAGDADGDGVPNLSDDDYQGGAVVTPPVLALARTAEGLALTVSGAAGQTVQLERATTLEPPDWEPAQTLTPAGDMETIPLEGAGERQFWRAVIR